MAYFVSQDYHFTKFNKMQNLKYLFISLLVLPFLSSCNVRENILIQNMEPVPACEKLDVHGGLDGPDDSVTPEIQFGTIMLLKRRGAPVPADGLPPKAADMQDYRIWVIIPDANPDQILRPCNLPEWQEIHDRKVAFTGIQIEIHPDLIGFEGVTPFNLIEISGGQEEPDPWDDC